MTEKDLTEENGCPPYCAPVKLPNIEKNVAYYYYLQKAKLKSGGHNPPSSTLEPPLVPADVSFSSHGFSQIDITGYSHRKK